LPKILTLLTSNVGLSNYTCRKPGVGVVIRNDKGEVVLMAWRVLFQCASAYEAEAQACAEGLQLASQWCPGPIIVETDSSRMLIAMKTGGTDRSELRYIFLEAKEYLQTLIEWRFQKVKRECNKVAHHELCHLARRNTHTMTWWRQAPACVINLLNDDNILPS
jgi:ribonuclease HI